MDEQKIAKLLELIGEAVNANGSWQEKRDAILGMAGDDDKVNLSEFATWFE